MTIATEFAKAFKSVTKDLHREKKRRERDARRVPRRYPSYRTTIKEAVFEVLPKAVAAASGNGKYTVPGRTLFYQVRPLIQEIVPDELNYNYFSQTLLRQYQDEFGPLEGLTRDPRGVLHEPHTGKTVPLGTVAVGSYEFPSYVFDKILYVEKEGLMPVLEGAQLAERYDLAIAAGKGHPTEAVRELFARAEAGDYRLFVLHDADPDGYSIARSMAEETDRMPNHNVEVVDLGLKVADAIKLGLPTETFHRKKALPWWMPDRLTDKENEWFEGEHLYRKRWKGTRVELNAFTAPALVAYIESALAKHGATRKVVPPKKVIVEAAEKHHKERVTELVNETIADVVDADDIIETVLQETKDVAKTTQKGIKEDLKDNPPEPWRTFVTNPIDKRLKDKEDEIEERVREMLSDHMGGDS